MEDQQLTLPAAVRNEFLTCPIRAREWRAMLARFDETYLVSQQSEAVVGKERQLNAESSLTASSSAALASSVIKLDALKDVCVTIAGPSWWWRVRSCGLEPREAMHRLTNILVSHTAPDSG